MLVGVAIAGQFAALRDLHGALRLAHVALAGGTLHCIPAYFFNTTVPALLMNIGAGLL